MPIPMLPTRSSLYKEVVNIISKRIASGEFPKNTFLPPERELCKAFGVSRTVVREAVKSLESDGWVNVKRGKGALVVDGHEKQLSRSFKRLVERRGFMAQHLMEVRRIVEVAMAGLAAERRTPANIAAMKRSLEIMRERPGDPAGYADADVEFHNEVARATQNPTLVILLEPIAHLLLDSRIISFSGIEGVGLRTKQHEEILRLIEEENAEGARQAMARHLSDTLSDLKERSK